MALPDSVQIVPVHVRVVAPDSGRPGMGQLVFSLPYPLRDQTGAVVVGNAQAITVRLDAAGEATVALPATDDPDLSPTGWTYAVEVITDLWRDRFRLEVPYSTVGTLELARVMPAVTPAALVTYETPAGAQAKADAARAAAVAAAATDATAKDSAVLAQAALRSSNLSDLGDPVAARASLGLGQMAVLDIQAARPQVSSIVPIKPNSGEYLVPPNSGTSTSATQPLGEVRYGYIDVPVAQAFSGLGCNLSALGVGGTTPLVHLGLYADDGTGNRPAGSPLAEVTFDPTSPSIGDRYYNFTGGNITLQPGRYWVAGMVTSGSAFSNAPGLVTVSVIGNLPLTVLSNASSRCWAQTTGTNAATLPAVSGLYRTGVPPLIGLRAV